jgi:hypothetical protein
LYCWVSLKILCWKFFMWHPNIHLNNQGRMHNQMDITSYVQHVDKVTFTI